MYRWITKKDIISKSKIIAEYVIKYLGNKSSLINSVDIEYNIYILDKNNSTIVVTTDKEFFDDAAFLIMDTVWKEIDNIDIDKIVAKCKNEVDKIIKIRQTIGLARLTMNEQECVPLC